MFAAYLLVTGWAWAGLGLGVIGIAGLGLGWVQHSWPGLGYIDFGFVGPWPKLVSTRLARVSQTHLYVLTQKCTVLPS